jgi:hypothetical protein
LSQNKEKPPAHEPRVNCCSRAAMLGLDIRVTKTVEKTENKINCFDFCFLLIKILRLSLSDLRLQSSQRGLLVVIIFTFGPLQDNT